MTMHGAHDRPAVLKPQTTDVVHVMKHRIASVAAERAGVTGATAGSGASVVNQHWMNDAMRPRMRSAQ